MGSVVSPANCRPAAAVVAAMGFACVACAQPLTIGAEDDAAPWSYADGRGYVNDLVRAVFRESGWDVRLQTLPYPRCKALALAGTLAACFSVSRTAELEPALLFPNQPVFRAQNLLLARSDSPWSGCDPARWGGPPVIGVVRGYEYVDAVTALVTGGRVRIDVSESEISNLRKVQAGRIPASIVTVDEVKRLDDLIRLAAPGGEFKTVCDFGALPPAYALRSVGRTREAPPRSRPSSRATSGCSAAARWSHCRPRGAHGRWMRRRRKDTEAMPRRRLSIAVLLIVVLVAVVTAVLGSFAAVVHHNEAQARHDHLRREVAATADQMAAALAMPMWNLDATTMRSVIESGMSDVDIAAIEATTADQRVVLVRDETGRVGEAETLGPSRGLLLEAHGASCQQPIGRSALRVAERRRTGPRSVAPLGATVHPRA